MSEGPIVDVLEAVTQIVVNGGSPFELLHSGYLPKLDGNLLPGHYGVIVMPRGIEAAPATRGHDQMDVLIDVGIVCSDVRDFDRRGDVASCLRAVSWLNKRLRAKLNTNPSASWIGRKCDPLYDVQKLQRDRLFYSVTTHTYRVIAAEPDGP